MAQPTPIPLPVRTGIVLALAVATLALGGCTARITFLPETTTQVIVATPAAGGFLIVRVPPSRPPSGLDVRTPSGEVFRIPSGHYPPVGACRIWVPGVPPGRQDPPGACADLERRVPPGAVLVIA